VNPGGFTAGHRQRWALRCMTRTSAIVLSCLLLGVRWGFAGISAPIPSGRISADGERILVLRPYPATNMPSDTGYAEEQITFPTNRDGTRIDIIRDFPVSGVYSLANKKLIHRIDWFSLSYEVLSSPDLAHIVRVNRFGKSWAVKFYADGIETKSYKLDDLLRHFRHSCFRPFTSWDWHTMWVDDYELSGTTLRVKTVDRVVLRWKIGYSEAYRFDLATGQMLGSNVAYGGLMTRCLLFASVLLMLVSLIGWMVRHIRRRKP
jgi:hypothetical protein